MDEVTTPWCLDDINLLWTWDYWKPSLDKPRKMLLDKDKPINLEDIKNHFIKIFVKTQNLPYDPLNWTSRGKLLSNIGYPELAVSDCYKALLLFDILLNQKSTEIAQLGWLQNVMTLWETWWPLSGFRYKQHDLRYKLIWDSEAPLENFKQYFSKKPMLELSYPCRAMLIGILCELEALADARRVCHQGNDTAPEQFGDFLKRLTKLCKRLRIRTELVFRDDDAGRYPNIEMGQIKLVRYPWIPQRFLYRNETDIEDANKKLRNCSNTLEIRRSPVEGQNKKIPLWEISDCLGIFASRNIKAGEKVFSSKGPLAVCRNQRDGGGHCYNCFAELSPWPIMFSSGCCPTMKFCTLTCRDLAEQYYHRVLCGKDFAYIFEGKEEIFRNQNSPGFAGIIWLKVLAICVQHGGHPLRHPIFSMLRLHYRGSFHHHWGMQSQVVIPLEILRKLGVDIFANRDWDQWVLQTLWYRVTLNATYTLGGQFHAWTLDPMFQFFNHSCELPSMMKQSSDYPAGTSSRQEFFATRDMKAGDEVLTNYLDRSISKQERHKALLSRFGGKCACRKCMEPESDFSSAIRQSVSSALSTNPPGQIIVVGNGSLAVANAISASIARQFRE